MASQQPLRQASREHLHPGALDLAARTGSAPVQPHAASAQRQQVCYLLDCESGELRLSLWVRQGPGLDATASTAVPYVPRAAQMHGEYPRYIDIADQSILLALAGFGLEGPWTLESTAGAALLAQVTRSGRAFWGTLQSQALRAGSPRRANLSWRSDDAGLQRLVCHAGGDAHPLLYLEPAHYIDPASLEWGLLELPCTREAIGRYECRPVAPEEVATVNAQLASEPDAGGLPRLASFPVRRQPLESLRARLILGADPLARLQYVYNGLPVDSRRLPEGQPVVRQTSGPDVYEIPRDHGTESALSAQLAAALPPRTAGREAWLGFLLDSAAHLTAAGWEIVTEHGFPYRLALPERWFGELDGGRTESWFHLRLGVMVDGEAVNLLPALAEYLRGSLEGNSATGTTGIGQTEPSAVAVGEHWLLRLADGRYVPIAMGRIRRIASMLVELFERDALDAGGLSLPRNQSYPLALLRRELDATLQPADPTLAPWLAKLDGFTQIEPLAEPEGFAAELRPYQREGLGWLQFLRRHGLGGVLADDMGLGKTVQALAHLLHEKRAGRMRKPALIVAPVSALAHWRQEVRRLAPALRELTLHGPARRARFAQIGSADIVITGYPQLQLDADALLRQDFSVVILDEAQMIKNPRAKVSQAACALRAEHRLCLTGTPLENHLGDLWSLFAFAQPDLFGGERDFQRRYRAPIERNGDRLRAEALTLRLKPFLLRRTKDAVAPELPPKSVMLEPIALDERQRDFYDAIRLASHRRIREIIERSGIARSQITILEALLKLRQACCDPRLIETGAEIPSAKLDWLGEALPELVADGRRILLFSQFTSMLRLIEAKARELAIPYCLLTGETRERAVQIERFQSHDAPLFLISLKAGGTALNLTAADTVIHFDPWWNPAAEAQATDRAHRIGQSKPVFVYKLIAQDTVEERMIELQQQKRALAAGLYAGASASPLSLTATDLERLLAP
ncbi:MAG: DEAD/DEAH box helicase [Gammaproteobacteria bacterium]|nr:DEAD/DEAH box helicase [Gammaproteobacteria bacterium]